MKAIDRIDSRGDIREHLTRDGAQTICGLSLLKTQTQPPCGNRKCKRCLRLATANPVAPTTEE